MSDYAFMKTGLVGYENDDTGIDAERLIDLLRVMVDQTWEIATRAVRHHGWRRPTPVEVPDVHAALKYQARFFLENMERGTKFWGGDEERSEASDEESRVFKTDGIPPHPQMRACRNDNPHRKHFVVCRELTKKFETIYRGTANEVLEQIKKDFPGGNPKGEFVVVVS